MDQNKTFYVQYLNNQPVGIGTHVFNGGFLRQVPLESIGHLIAASITEPTRRQIGLPEKFGPISIHTTQTDSRLKSSTKLSDLSHGLDVDEPLIMTAKCIQVNESSDIVKLRYSQQNASVFVSSKCTIMPNMAFNGIFEFTFNLPEVIRQAMIENVSGYIAESVNTLSKGLLPSIFPIAVQKHPQIRNTTPDSRTVFDITDGALSGYFSGQSSNLPYLVCSNNTLSAFSATEGPVIERSIPDNIVCAMMPSLPSKTGAKKVRIERRIGLAVIEYKDTSVSTLEQIGQAAGECANLAQTLKGYGMDLQHCVVPWISTNGNLYQFGWVSLLAPCFPVLHVTSKILDVSDSTDMSKAAALLAKVKLFCEAQARRLAALPCAFEKVFSSLSLDICHLKTIDDIFLRCPEIETHLHYMWRVFEVLGPLELESVVHPLGYAKIDFESGQDNQYKNGEYLIFPRVDHSYLKPFPVDQYDSFIKLLIKSVKEIHTKNVVHMDLYPSNLMIRYTSKVELRIIDWDVATFVGESFTDQMEERLSKSSLGSYYYKRNGSAEFKCDSWFVFVLASLNKEEIVRFCKEPDDRPKVFQDAVRRLYEEHEQELKNEVLDAWIEAHW